MRGCAKMPQAPYRLRTKELQQHWCMQHPRSSQSCPAASLLIWNITSPTHAVSCLLLTGGTAPQLLGWRNLGRMESKAGTVDLTLLPDHWRRELVKTFSVEKEEWLPVIKQPEMAEVHPPVGDHHQAIQTLVAGGTVLWKDQYLSHLT